ncbi:4-hydroxy-tetrahydrodipicolinate synthase [Gemmatimonas sp.]|jgi:4-hydroxy-tetrahydrodipicolinate synthase|uniref:4-hydroxy-tetrahydrodipicolinate synthase n=1 Tax=Gemmatimonas sp. TaxID=1962908 RepID=UPI0022BB37B2|nr:4-hydroxy-tetrahydrodipicolinate synthase [Gemmatimonas sp.]MCA2984389.1 4-hydroxy-tetrahydrodipicolinate synthase [Gemmatimonas sp.]MCA2988167.1 4-hydroxy-tetrahydrodipicolinate synthase [Gemmatimonas sp.]MCA2994092.1 4-hydroxy-tetrahydrodipicolinate synthase [Gemmatimonas sp.]MCZ8013165.1 4-hydroxy-tetrahydrodipicolinate synthase [Gemmatimonas sp.]MCZ8265439.1 4-hydroxy-tetrahydrodipicolinate synthase [Gemmatimonas sp.]
MNAPQSTTMLHGCGTAIVTPFTVSGAIDEAALRALVEWQVVAGVHMVVPCGSTGEAATLTPAEHRRVVEITVEQVNGRIPVVAGAGSNDTQRAIAMSREMRAIGATHLLQVTPMYNKPPQRALIAHFRAIADACDLPIVLYNVPGRTAVNMEAATTLTLAQDPRFVAVKEASGNLSQMTTIIRERPSGFAVLSGDDSFTLALMAHGGEGVISVVANVAPARMAALCDAMRRQELPLARQLDAALAPLVDACFVESNPIPAKAMLAMMGRVQDVVRAPLVPLADALRASVRDVLVQASLLS